MTQIRRFPFVLISALLMLVGVFSVQAQAAEPESLIVFFIAPDANGVQQVFQGSVGPEAADVRQVTQAAEDVQTFGAAFDMLSVAYISGDQLWLQPLHTEEAEALAALEAPQFFSTPVFSQDGQYLAYADTGVWLMDLATRETRQILANIPLAEDGSNMGDYRLYAPDAFVQNDAGTIDKLIVDVGVWEMNTTGVYDLSSEKLAEVEAALLHTDLLPLADGSALVFGNNGAFGEPTVEWAESLNALGSATTVLDLNTVSDATLFADQAVEIAPGVVRLSGTAMEPGVDGGFVFTLDLDVAAGTHTEPQFLPLNTPDEPFNFAGPLSPDGQLLPIYHNAQWTERGVLYGALTLHNLETGETVEAVLPEVVYGLEWAK